MNAWITFVNSEEYMRGAIVIARCLKLVNSIYSFVVLVPNDFIYNINVESNMIVLPITQLIGNGNNCKDERYRYCLNKIHIWTLTDYDKLCWLDSDLLILKNIDNVFDELEFSSYEVAAACGCRCNALKHNALETLPEACPFIHTEKTYINAGVMIIKPNVNIYEMLLQQDYDFPFADQDVFNMFFCGKIKQISSKYNYLNHLPIAHPEVSQDFSVFHFGYGKPWSKDNSLGSHQQMYDIWNEIDTMYICQ